MLVLIARQRYIRIMRRAKMKYIKEKWCVWCNKSFMTWRVDKVYCTKRCSLNAQKARLRVSYKLMKLKQEEQSGYIHEY